MMHISPSQAKTAESCRRKWYLEKVEKIPQLQGRATFLGSAVHAVAEAWLRNEPYDLQAPAARIFDPVVNSWVGQTIRSDGILAIERPISIILPRSGVELQGRIDLIAGTPNKPIVLDWKTTRSPRYAKSADELATDVQMTSYAAAVSAACFDVPVGHIYMVTKGAPKAWRVDAIATVDAQRATLDRLDTLACDLVELRTQPREAAPQNLESCGAYGGCPYRYVCFPATHTKEIDMSAMLDRMRARQAGTAAPAPATPPPAAPPPPESRAADEYADAAASAAYVPPTEPVAVLPPDAPQGATSIADTPPKRKPGRPRKTPLLDVIPATVTAIGDIHGPLAVTAPEPTEPLTPADFLESMRRMGPTEESRKIEREIDATAFPPPADAPKPAASAPLGAGIVLLIDCAPLALPPGTIVGPPSFATYAAEIATSAAGEAELPDWRLIPYGKGAGMIAALVRAAPPPPGIYLVDSRSPTQSAVLDALLPLASVVIRGL